MSAGGTRLVLPAEAPGARAAFDALSYTQRMGYARQVGEAKAAETRQRRIAAIVAKLPTVA